MLRKQQTEKGKKTSPHVSLLPIAILTKQDEHIKEEEGYVCERKSASVYPALWKCSVKSQMTTTYFVSTCIGTYCGKEEHIPHSVALKSSIRTSWTVRIWKEKQT